MKPQNWGFITINVSPFAICKSDCFISSDSFRFCGIDGFDADFRHPTHAAGTHENR
ncbi:MAG: hypothetical protein ABWX93_05860 [Pseudoxanthomonas sp.]